MLFLSLDHFSFQMDLSPAFQEHAMSRHFLSPPQIQREIHHSMCYLRRCRGRVSILRLLFKPASSPIGTAVDVLDDVLAIRVAAQSQITASEEEPNLPMPSMRGGGVLAP